MLKSELMAASTGCASILKPPGACGRNAIGVRLNRALENALNFVLTAGPSFDEKCRFRRCASFHPGEVLHTLRSIDRRADGATPAIPERNGYPGRETMKRRT